MPRINKKTLHRPRSARGIRFSKSTRKRKLKVAVLMGGPSDEHAVSIASARNVLAHLDRSRYQPRSVMVDSAGRWRRSLLPTNTDLVFNALHGTFGEDGTVQGFLDTLGIPYTGSGIAASSIGMDKWRTKLLFRASGLPVPEAQQILHTADLEKFSPSQLPVIIKPQSSGSSVGLNLARTREQARKAVRAVLLRFGPVLVEPYIQGRELTVPVIGNDQPRALPVIEIVPKSGPLFDYKAKYQAGASREETPAKINDAIRQEVQDLAMQAHTIVGCRGYSRTDIMLGKDGRPRILEINTLPGLTQQSLLPKSAAAGGLTMSDLLNQIIELALEV
jgi:D-alanine-D-alanine ligase